MARRRTPLSVSLAAPDRQRGNAARGPAQPKPVKRKPRAPARVTPTTSVRGRDLARAPRATAYRGPRPGPETEADRRSALALALLANPDVRQFRSSSPFITRFGSDLKTAALNAPAGVVYAGKTVGTDLYRSHPEELVGLRAPGKRDRSFEGTRELGKQTAKATYADLRHPLRHPGYTALDLLGAVGGGGGVTARTVATGRALRAGEGVGRALTREGHEGGSLLHRPIPRETTLETEPSRGRAGLHSLRQQAKRHVDEAHAQMERVALKTGALFERSPTRLKTSKRAMQKVERDYAGDPSQELDVTRGRIVVRNHAQLQAVVAELKREGNLVRAKDTLSKPEPRTGYGDLKLYVRHGQHVSEIQVQPLSVRRAHARLWPVYKQWRELPKDSPRREVLAARMRAGYGQAMAEWEGRPIQGAMAAGSKPSKAARSTTTPSETGKSRPTGRGGEVSQASVSSLRQFDETGMPLQSKRSRPARGSEAGVAEILDRLNIPLESVSQGMPGLRVQRLEPDAPYLRPLHRLRTRQLNRKLQARIPPSEFRAIRFLQRHFGAENVMRRELGERHAAEARIAQAPVEAARRRAKKLSAAENAAVRVVATEGRHALSHPDEAVSRHIATHLRWAREATDPVDRRLNVEIAKDLKRAAPILRNPSRPFLEAVASTRRVSRESARQAIEAGALTKATADERRAGIAAEYGRTGKAYRVRERSSQELQARLSKLDAKYERLVAKVAEQVNPMIGKLPGARGRSAKQLEATYRNRSRNRLRGGIRRGDMPKVEQDLRALAEERIEKAVAANPKLPASRLILEREEIRRRLNALGEASLAGEPAPSLGTVAGFGRHGAPTGSFYFPTGERFKLARRPGPSSPPSRRPGPQGLGRVQTGRFLQGTMRRATFKGLRRGVVERPTEAIATRATGTNRLVAAQRVHADLRAAGVPERTHDWQIPIRDTADLPMDAKRQLAVELERLVGGDESALARAMEALRPGDGEHALWVDARTIPEFQAGSPSKLLRAVAAINKPNRFLGVYARPAYFMTNRPQNFMMRKLAQGLRTHKPVRGHVAKVRSVLGEELSAKIDAAGGQTRTQMYEPQATRVGRVEHAVVEKITELTDRDERFLSVLARAHERGYRTPEQLHRLFSSRAPAKVVEDRISIARRADKDLVQFSTNSTERELAQFAYFYPWLKSGSVWAGRFVFQHPVKAGVLAQLARVGEEHQPEWLRHGPHWMRGYVASKLGVSNPAPVNTFATPAEIADTVAHPGRARSYGEEFGTPSLEAVTSKPTEVPGRLFGQGTAPGQMLRRAGVRSKFWLGPTSKTFPPAQGDRLERAAQVAGPFLVGGPFPRQPDQEAVREQGLRELPFDERVQARALELEPSERELFIQRELRTRRRKDLPPERRALLHVYDDRELVFSEAKRLGLVETKDGKLPRSLRKAFTVEAKRQALYAKASAGIVPGTREYQAARFEADVVFLRSFDAIDEAAAAKARAKASRADRAELKAYRDYISRHFYSPGFLSPISGAKKYLREHGAVGLD